MKALLKISNGVAVIALMTACQAQYKTTEPKPQETTFTGSQQQGPASRPTQAATQPPPTTWRADRSIVPDDQASLDVRTQPVGRSDRKRARDYGNDNGGDDNNDARNDGDRRKTSPDQRVGDDSKRTDGGSVKKVKTVVTTETKVVKRDGKWIVQTWKKTCHYYVKTDGNCTSQEFEQPKSPITNKLDLMFVVDTSDSLDGDRQEVAKSIDDFLAQLPKNIDIRVAVLPAHGTTSPNNLSGKLFSTDAGEPKVLKSTELSTASIRSALMEKFAKVPRDALNSDHGELGLFSLTMALSAQNLKRIIADGMFRTDAALAVVFFADENDLCAQYPRDVTPSPNPNGKEAVGRARDCHGISVRDINHRLQELKKDGMPYTVNGLLYTSPSQVNNNDRSNPWAIESEVGYGYLDLIKMTNGVGIPLKSTSIKEGLIKIGERMNMKLGTDLDFPVADGKFTGKDFDVFVDGQLASKDDYSYHTGTRHIHMRSAGHAGSRVRINYCQP